MFGQIKSPKSDLHSQATERRTTFPQIALRRRSQDHPMVMFSGIVAAAFIWVLVPSNPGSAGATVAPLTISDTQTSGKTSRLPISDLDRVCRGQAWGEETADCLSEIARENGKAAFKVRLIADAAPADLNTPNIF